MRTKKLFPVLIATILISVSGWSLAAEGDASPQHHSESAHGMKSMPGMNTQMMGNMSGNGMMGHGMMGGGMMGMMGGGMMGGGCPMLGQLPAGNEGLAMRMHGEMMEAMGKILVKYADKIQPQQPK